MTRPAAARPLLALVLLLFVEACGGLWGSETGDQARDLILPERAQAATATPFLPGEPAPSITPAEPTVELPTPTPTLTPTPEYLWISPVVPDLLRQYAVSSGLPLTDDPIAATFSLDLASGPEAQSTWIYALVTPYPSLVDEVSLADLRAAWGGAWRGPFAGRPLWLDQATLNTFIALWGSPAAGFVSVAPASELLDIAWAQRPAWALVPFEAIEPRWKVLSVDGQSPIHNDFDPNAYGLQVAFSLRPGVFALPAGNRDPSLLTVLAMTGVTALVRGTADRMERKGVLYPGEQVRDVLRAADVAHISNEVPFAQGCPPPDPYTQSLRFCSDPSYIALLEDVGTDIVELTGNHFQDYGTAAALSTMDLYDQYGMLYFGGGRDLESAFRPILMTDHGNRLAFLGCNYAGPVSDWATDLQPGSTPCDFPRLEAEIAGVRAAGYLPIMTFQYYEYDQPYPSDYELRDFRRMAAAGATIVSGSQSHFPAAMEFYGESFIHYGLGNLFFDQMFRGELRMEFIDLHVFYDGRYLGTELLTYQLEDYSRPRPMTPAERSSFLEYIFEAAGW